MSKSISIPNIFGVGKKQEQSIQNLARLRPRQVLVKKKTHAFWPYASYLLLVVNCLILFSYLFGVNTAASAGYEIKKIQRQIDILSEENKKISLQISQQSSITNIQDDMPKAGYVPILSAQFLKTDYFSEAEPIIFNP